MSHAYRAPMRSRREDVEPGAGVERALARGLCGMAGALEPTPATVDEAVVIARAVDDERLARRIARFAAAPDGSYVWTRDDAGHLWLGRLAGPWRYDASPAAARADLIHVRECRWRDAPVAPPAAPGGVHATFARGGLNWQRIHAADVAPGSARLWRDSGEPRHP